MLNIHRFTAVTKTFMTLIRDLLYTDDCDFVTHTDMDLQLLMDCFSTACDEFGLTISLKTTVMLQPAPGEPYIPPLIYIKGKI